MKGFAPVRLPSPRKHDDDIEYDGERAKRICNGRGQDDAGSEQVERDTDLKVEGFARVLFSKPIFGPFPEPNA